ncbi:transposon Ty3-I Gag-Pol polyprotein [Trichonephila clavipes]|nr:transposon Ty3-I Gag-Pol polyprotein [Trichonephila clavipes]
MENPSPCTSGGVVHTDVTPRQECSTKGHTRKYAEGRKTLSKKELNPRIARWALYLQEFNYTIEHRTGSKMAHVDALSRPPHCMLIQNSVHLQFFKAQ